MTLARALLPLAAIAALLVTLALPLMVPSDPDFDEFRITSIGEQGDGGLLVMMLAVWALVLTAAGLAWIPRWPALWSVAAFVAALAMFLLPVMLMLDPPMLIWDGWDEANDRGTGGMVVGRPFFGSALWLLGSFALTASGLLGIAEAVLPRLRRGRAARSAG